MVSAFPAAPTRPPASGASGRRCGLASGGRGCGSGACGGRAGGGRGCGSGACGGRAGGGRCRLARAGSWRCAALGRWLARPAGAVAGSCAARCGAVWCGPASSLLLAFPGLRVGLDPFRLPAAVSLHPVVLSAPVGWPAPVLAGRFRVEALGQRLVPGVGPGHVSGAHCGGYRHLHACHHSPPRPIIGHNRSEDRRAPGRRIPR